MRNGFYAALRLQAFARSSGCATREAASHSEVTKHVDLASIAP
jgi:hypothetical protein